MDGRRFGWALLLACPACAGSLVLALAGAVGVGALAFKSLVLAAAGAALATAWGWNWYRRRGECAVPVSLDPNH